MEDQNLTKKELYDQRKKQQKETERVVETKKGTKTSWLKVVLVLAALIALFGVYKLVSAPTDPSQKSAAETILTVQNDDWTQGNKEVPVTLIEYLDFECEACRAYYPLVKEMEAEFGEDLLVITRYLPLPGHKNSFQAALAVEAAGRQGKYWEMHDALFEAQDAWGNKPSADPKLFIAYAQKIGLDMAQWEADRVSDSVKERVNRNKFEADKLGLSGTPSFFLNGEKIQNPKTPEDLKTLIRAAKLKAPTKETALGEKVHEHADFAVYLEGKKFDFTQAKYQSSTENPIDTAAHLHDGNGEVTHKHRKGVTLGYFFETLGMKLDANCFTTDDGKQYCANTEKKLRIFVNGMPNDQLGKYEFADLDKILITYGDETGVADQITSVSDDACLYSEKCPERGKAPTENCVGGLGTEC